MSPESTAAGVPYRKRSHAWIDARGLELARCVAEKLRRDPTLLDRARQNLARWKLRFVLWPRPLEEWEEILSRSPLETVLSLLLEDTEEGRRRRQSSPFTGILSPQERRAVFEKYETIGA